jgi:ankyrin repeat protein
VTDSGNSRGRGYLRALLVGMAIGVPLCVCLVRWYGPPLAFTRPFGADFEWDSARGFKTFRVKNNAIGDRAGGRLWQYLVGIQVKPRLASYLKRVGWQRIDGSVALSVLKIVPLTYPEALGSDGEILHDPDVTALMQAADRGDERSVRGLLATGASVNARDQSGNTALIHACMRGNSSPSLVEALLAAGANPNARNNAGETATALAEKTGRTEIVEFLMEAEAKQ